MQISKKLVTESSPDKLHRQVDLLMPSTEVPHRKSSLNGLSSRNEFKIFTPIDKYYNEIHSPTRLKYTESNENTQRRLNPTYISSDLGYVWLIFCDTFLLWRSTALFAFLKLNNKKDNKWQLSPRKKSTSPPRSWMYSVKCRRMHLFTRLTFFS